ncbi:MAG: Phenol hydroxylase, oxygenase component DmpL [Edaphobacter sp.]|nr:Phenol hydroxylase, oxygenase component DmpL [Edaphobacter sp.]
MSPQKTYWHLQQQGRVPSEYEIVTSKLLIYTGEGFTGRRFELDVPLKDWYAHYQVASPLRCSSWEKFRDPRETTYTKYTGIQLKKEIFVDNILQEIETTGYDERLSGTLMYFLSRVFAPLRYPVHALQMVAAYVAQMAPGGRIAITATLQMADEIRRVERLAYRIRQLQFAYPGFAEDSQARWERDPLWQPLREAVEKLLVVYDWGEAFVGLNLVLKPLFDQLFMKCLGEVALREGDYLLGQILYSLREDCLWQQRWSVALVQVAMEDTGENRDVIQAWVDKWHGLALPAVSAFFPVFAEKQDTRGRRPAPNIPDHMNVFYAGYLESMHLRMPVELPALAS